VSDKPARLSLVHKGLVLIFMPLLIQVVLVMKFSSLWREAEVDANNTIRAAMKIKGAPLTEEQKAAWREQQNERTNLHKRMNFLLLAAVAGNLIVASVISALFIFSITRRLVMINDNLLRLSDRKSLRQPLGGNDEIAHLDSVFHDMAISLNEAQDRLADSEKRLRLLIESIPVGVMVVDDDGNVRLGNESIKKTFGIEEKELAGKPLAEMLPALKRDGVGETNGDGSTQTLETIAISDGGHEIPVEVILRKWQVADESQVLVTVQDITERRQVEQLKQDFVAMVTHDLRSPLTSIQLFHQLLRAEAFGALPGKSQDTLVSAERSVTRLLTLVNDLLDVEKLESGQLRLNPRQTKLSTILSRSIEAIQELAQHHQITLESTEFDIDLVADEDRLIQVVINLLSNAIKFSPEKSTVSISACRRDDGRIEVAVTDQGRGVPQSEYATIFQKYHQVDPEGTREKHGTGLGLPICKGIILQHGGDIGVESEVGKGSRFWFRIPQRHDEGHVRS
jgi:PAS domain S-box-containing protein